MVEWHLDRLSHWLDMTVVPAPERLRWARQEVAPLLAALARETPTRQAEVLQWLGYLLPQLFAEGFLLPEEVM
jgi:hypothetical protein